MKKVRQAEAEASAREAATKEASEAEVPRGKPAYARMLTVMLIRILP